MITRVHRLVLLLASLLTPVGSAAGAKSTQHTEIGKAKEIKVDIKREDSRVPVTYADYLELRRPRRVSTAGAKETHRSLVKEMSREGARQWVLSRTDDTLVAYLSAIERLPESFKQPLSMTVGGRTDQIADLRQRYLELVMRESEQDLRMRLNRLSDREREMLLNFAREKGVHAESPKQLDIDTIEEWNNQLFADRAKLEVQWPVLNPEDHSIATAAHHLKAQFSDAHEQNYARSALQDRISATSGGRLKRYGIESWTYRSHDPARSADEILQFLALLDQPLPGGSPELVYFLDPVKDAGPAESLTQAWAAPGRSIPRFLDHANTDRFLSEFRGRTLIMIGHMENRAFFMQRRDGLSPLIIDLPDLIERASDLGVFLVPLGCNSADQGALFGFTRPIDTNEIAPMLQGIPVLNATVGDLLGTLGAIGAVTVDLTGMLSRGHVDVSSRRNIFVNREVREVQVTVVRLPVALGQSSGGVLQASQPFDVFLEGWERHNRSLLDKGVLRFWRALYRHSPNLTLLGSGLLLLFAGSVWDRFRSAIWPRQVLQSRTEWWIRWILERASWVVLLCVPLRLAFDLWNGGDRRILVLIGLLVAAIVVSVLESNEKRA